MPANPRAVMFKGDERAGVANFIGLIGLSLGDSLSGNVAGNH